MERLNYSINNERGDARILSIVGILGLSCYLIFGSMIFGQLPPAANWGIIGLLSVLTLFSLGYAIHVQILGERPRRDFHRQLSGKVAEIEKIVFDATEKEQALEDEMVSHFHAVSRKGTECLANIKRIVRALEHRTKEIKSLLVSHDSYNLLAAHDLLTSETIEIGGNRLDSLIDAEPVPAMKPAELALVLARLVEELGSEVEKSRTVQNQYRNVA